MPRLRRTFAATSLLAFIALIALWGRSTGRGDRVGVGRTGEGGTYTMHALVSGKGSLGLYLFVGGVGTARGPLGRHFVSTGDSAPPGILGFRVQRGSATIPSQTSWGYWMLPYAIPILLTALAPGVACAALIRTNRRLSAGRCPTCGYDVRATPGRCPECGPVATNASGGDITRHYEGLLVKRVFRRRPCSRGG